jgi:hypothetical protein
MKKQTLVPLVVIGGLMVSAWAGCSKPPEQTKTDIIKAQKASAAADARVRQRPAEELIPKPRGSQGRPGTDSSVRQRQ